MQKTPTFQIIQNCISPSKRCSQAEESPRLVQLHYEKNIHVASTQLRMKQLNKFLSSNLSTMAALPSDCNTSNSWLKRKEACIYLLYLCKKIRYESRGGCGAQNSCHIFYFFFHLTSKNCSIRVKTAQTKQFIKFYN